MPRPKLNPTAEQRSQVRVLAAVGTSQPQIARHLGIRSVKTLRRHFRQKLDEGSLEANTNVAKALYQSAISGKNLVATIFWLKFVGYRLVPAAPLPEQQRDSGPEEPVLTCPTLHSSS